MEQIIYIEQNDRDEATKLSKSFTIKETSNRAYINGLGVEIALKYLAQAGINVTNAYNIHNINKIREEFDIADIMLPNIHIDIRMVYNSDEIFIPKSHFEYNLVPDIYLVFEVAQDSTHVKFLGFFEPKLINKNNKNKDYYFIEKEKLSNPDDLKSYIDNHNGNTTQSLTESEEELGQKLALSLIDNDITTEQKKELISMLKKSSVLRQDLIEFDNFELISYHTSQIDDFKNPDTNITKITNTNVDEFEMFDTPFENQMTTNDLSNEPLETIEPIETLDTIEPIEELTPIENNIETLDTIEPIEELTPIENNVETLDTIEPIEELTPIENNVETLDTIEPIEELTPIENNVETLDTIEPIEIINNDENTTNTAEIIKNVDELNAIEDIPSLETIEEITSTITENTELEISETPEVLEISALEETPSKNIIEELILEETEAKQEIDFTSESYDALDTLFNDGETQQTNIPKVTTPPPLPPQKQAPVTEKEPEIKKNKSFENSTIISNKNMSVGEIIIDINDTTANNNINDISAEAIEKIQTAAIGSKQTNGKKNLMTAIVLLAIIGSGLAYTLLNKKTDDKNIINEIPENKIAKDLPVIPTEDVLNDSSKPLNTKLPSAPNDNTKPTKKTQQKVEKKPVEKVLPKGPAIETPYLEVQKLSWSIPDYLSYNEPFKNYLQTTGKSLKLTLSSDLLLATEYSYSNKLQVDIELSKEGAIKDITMLQSSGSTQIDDIVLRTVKNTLNVLKAPNDAIVGDNLHLTLIIYL